MENANSVPASSAARLSFAASKKERKHTRADDLAEQDRKILVQELENAVIYFCEANMPVYLEGLGILFPKTLKRNRVTTLKDKYVIHTETLRTVAFEKCSELVSLHRERFKGILELKDLAARIHEKSAAFLSTSVSAQDVRRIVRGFIDAARNEVIQSGRTSFLKAAGDFYALHNRQGETFADWFAGADILIKSKFQKVLDTQSSRFLDRPVFLNAIEPFSVLYGDPMTLLTVDLKRELKALGWDINDSSMKLSPFSIAVFASADPEKPSDRTLTFVSDGLRRIAASKGDGSGNEFVVQCTLEARKTIGSVSESAVSTEDVPSWPLRLFTAAWILLQSSKQGRVNAGAGLHIGATHLFSDENAQLSTILTTRCKKIGGEQLAEDRAFEYLNLTAVTDDEASVASTHGVQLLSTLLEHKKLAAVTKPLRSSIVARTALSLAH